MPELKEVPEVAQLLATLLTGGPVTHGALAVIPLLAPNLDDPNWLTLEEAGARARVAEVSEAGSVPKIRGRLAARCDDILRFGGNSGLLAHGLVVR